MTHGNEPQSGLTLAAFLDRLADRTPTPGGGGAAALAGALAAALARMVGAYSVDKQPDEHTQDAVRRSNEQLAQADAMLRRLMTEDAAAYASLSAALRARRQGRDDPAGRARAVALALAVPLEMAAVAGNALAVMEELLPHAKPSLQSDLGVAAVLADACARAAAYSVRVNVSLLDDPGQGREVLQELTDILRRAARTAAAIESALPVTLRPPPSSSTA
jgi:formiminotetrahydrofolate cyclodeaminase